MSGDSLPDSRSGLINRRVALQGIGGLGLAALAQPAAGHAAVVQETAHLFTIEPNAGSWKTWVLPSGDARRPAAPPDAAATAAELADLKAAPRSGADRDRIAYWDAGSPGYRWNQIAMQHTIRSKTLPGFAYRVMALLNAAIYDATVASWDAKYAYNRPRPAVEDPSIETALPTPASPSYPSEYAATAGAAATVLGHLFPDAANTFTSLAEEAAGSRVSAGVEFPSDASAGIALGRQIGELFVERARIDGSDAVFDPVSMATGDGLWTGEPLTPTLGTWKTWILANGAELRPGPPPEWDSPERAAEIDEVRTYQRDAFPGPTVLFFWPENPAGPPDPDTVPFSSSQAAYYYAPVQHVVWAQELAQKISEYRLDTNPPRAAQVYALVSIAGFDATVACWDAKFHYMTARPNQFDPGITTLFPTPPIPDSPSGHASTLGGTAQVLAHLFPRDGHFFQSRAAECAASRMWAGIHFRSACDEGLALGRAVGNAVIAHAEADGAD